MIKRGAKILVTGSKGYLGRFLTERLNACGANVIESNRDSFNLLDRSGLVGLKGADIQYIIHAATVTHKPLFETFELNNLMNFNILCAYRDYFPNAVFVGFGTSASYPSGLKRVEENYLAGEPEMEYEQYAVSKRLLLYGLRALSEQFGMRYLYFVPSCLYGEGFKKDDSHFIYDIIRKVCDARYLNKEFVPLYGNGSQVRDLIYIQDAVDIIIDRMENAKGCELLNLTSGYSRPIKEYVHMVCDIVGFDYSNVVYDFSTHRGVADRTMYNRVEFRFTPLESGLKKTIEYYLKTICSNTAIEL